MQPRGDQRLTEARRMSAAALMLGAVEEHETAVDIAVDRGEVLRCVKHCVGRSAS